MSNSTPQCTIHTVQHHAVFLDKQSNKMDASVGELIARRYEGTIVGSQNKMIKGSIQLNFLLKHKNTGATARQTKSHTYTLPHIPLRNIFKSYLFFEI